MPTNLSANEGKQTETLLELRCVAGWTDEIEKQLIFLGAINIFLSLTALIGNTLILQALRKESSLHPPSKVLYRCLATADLCVGLIAEPFQVAFIFSLVHKNWRVCRIALASVFIADYTLCSVSISTATIISVDRLLALLLGLRYRKVVTLKKAYVLLNILWVVSIAAGTTYFVNHRIAIWYSFIGTPLCLVTATFSYTMIFFRLHHNQNHWQTHLLQRPNEPIPRSVARYRKVVYNTLWVQLAMVVCYLPYVITAAVLPGERKSPSDFIFWTYAVTLVNFSSSLNPILYCWKIGEVRQAVKETVRRALCCSWSWLQ
ncbi:melanocyte-stimulating hormone receptor-like [Stylophora pistillata]|uniref:melanocyte-stimulating hormone receptor-like n=1 Tax=Stylophora pistillata TaxID=50429 RepID=UPI000C051E23|nr:melanocyte-stimulating hormone receptor-like [Stylophora pistillata]